MEGSSLKLVQNIIFSRRCIIVKVNGNVARQLRFCYTVANRKRVMSLAEFNSLHNFCHLI